MTDDREGEEGSATGEELMIVSSYFHYVLNKKKYNQDYKWRYIIRIINKGSFKSFSK